MKKEKQNPASGMLKKKISALTSEDLAVLEKPLGTAGRPFPMWGPQRVDNNGTSELEIRLSVIASDSHPMRVYSERPYDEVMAMAYCDMPVPSMLDIFMEGLERRADPIMRQKDLLEGKTPQNENYNRTQMMLGDPGHGKSFMGALMGRIRSKGSVEVFDCGGKNMNDLLFEMVLDFGAGDALPKAIDKRLAAGALEPLSLAMLKQLPQDVLSLDDNGGLKGLDWSALKSSGDDVQAAFDILKKVSSIEGLDNAGGNALGMNSQYGALVRAFLENREIVLDEYNKSKEGSDNALQTVIQFLIGEIRECTVENPLKNKDNTSGPASFTFKREDMGAGFFVTFTGNKTEDGTTTRSLNKSVYDRLKPDTLPDPEKIDWQHRICQMMVGMPVSTLYLTYQEFADSNPDAFGDWLMQLRQKKAEIEGTPIPELQETLLMNWKNVVSASEKLADFYGKWAEMTDAVKLVANNHTDLLEEVDEEYSKKEAMSFRRIKQHLEESIPVRPRMLDVDAPVAFDPTGWDKAPKLSEKVEENPSLRFGTRLVEYLEAMIYKKSAAVGKHTLYTKLSKALEECGLREIHLQDAARSAQRSVEEDLNISAFDDRDLSKQAKMARKIFCDYLRQADPQITATDEQIITDRKLLEALQDVTARTKAGEKPLYAANRDHEGIAAGKALVEAVIFDAADDLGDSVDEDQQIDICRSNMVDHDDFMAALALPTVGAANLASVWDKNIRRYMETGDAAADRTANDNDEVIAMAENTSAVGIATTSLIVSDSKRDTQYPIHIVRNENRGKTLIVGEKVSPKLLAAFNEAGIIHVDRSDRQAAAKIEAALGELTRNTHTTTRERLEEAFKLRNQFADGSGKDSKSGKMVEMMLDRDGVEMIYVKCLMKKGTLGKG